MLATGVRSSWPASVDDDIRDRLAQAVHHLHQVDAVLSTGPTARSAARPQRDPDFRTARPKSTKSRPVRAGPSTKVAVGSASSRPPRPVRSRPRLGHRSLIPAPPRSGRTTPGSTAAASSSSAANRPRRPLAHRHRSPSTPRCSGHRRDRPPRSGRRHLWHCRTRRAHLRPAQRFTRHRLRLTYADRATPDTDRHLRHRRILQ